MTAVETAKRILQTQAYAMLEGACDDVKSVCEALVEADKIVTDIHLNGLDYTVKPMRLKEVIDASEDWHYKFSAPKRTLC